MTNPENHPPEYKHVEWLLPRLYYCIGGGVSDWFAMLKSYPLAAIVQTGRGRPNMTYDFIQQRGKEAFADVSDKVKVIDEYETILLRVLNGGPTIKINKLGSDGRVHPPNTERSTEFYNAGLFDTCEGEDFSTIVLRAGYRLMTGAAALADVRIQRQQGDEVIWSFDIDEPPAGHQFTLVPKTPIAPHGSTTIGITLPGETTQQSESS